MQAGILLLYTVIINTVLVFVFIELKICLLRCMYAPELDTHELALMTCLAYIRNDLLLKLINEICLPEPSLNLPLRTVVVVGCLQRIPVPC